MTDCCLTFSDPVSKETIHSLVVDVIEYVLFYRGQMPCLLNQKNDNNDSKMIGGLAVGTSRKTQSSDNVREFGDILIYTDPDCKTDNNQIKKPLRAEQLFMESMSRFNSFFQDLSSLLQRYHVLEVVLKLGSSFPSPEIYHIKLPTMCENAECSRDSVPIHKWRSQVYQALFRSNLTSDLIEKPKSISVMLHLLSGSKLMSNMEYKRSYSVPKSSRYRSVYFNYCCSHVTVNPVLENLPDVTTNNSASENIASNITNASLWVLVKPELKGIPKKKF